MREGLETRLADSLRTALDLGGRDRDLETAPSEGEPERITLFRKIRVPVSVASPSRNRTAPVLVQRAVWGLPDCDGLGMELFFDERLVVPDET